MARVFVIRPFDVKKDSAGNPLDFERVHTLLIAKAIENCGLGGSTTGEIVEPGSISADMFSLIVEADIVICDITIHNANVFYELGIRHALRKRRTILIKGVPTADSTPFDIVTDRHVQYSIKEPETAVDTLTAVIRAAIASERDTDSPIFKMLPELPEADPTRIQAVPLGFREEIARAVAAKSKGWLRLLAHDVRSLRFQRTGLLLVANAMWESGDFEAARESFEDIRELVLDDAATNLALGTIYERLYRSSKIPEQLASSDQALERVMNSERATPQQAVEALALKGRNHKTRWREEFASANDLASRREQAMNEALRASYDAYYAAFQRDLNHFYSGLAALQMGVIFLDLSSDPESGWKDSFETNPAADAYRQRLLIEVEMLRSVVAASADAALNRMSSDNDVLWAKVTRCDLLFLNEDNVPRIVKRYQGAVPSDKRFVWDAAKGQLGLFASLGVREALARAVIAGVDGAPVGEQQAQDKKPQHIVVFVGHRVDEPARAQPRFPSVAVPAAFDKILSQLGAFTETHEVIGLACAAPGADILFHEACDRLQIKSTVCLPMPSADYLKATFNDIEWRGRFVALLARRNGERPAAVLELADREGLPAWLHGSRTNAWERGNRWVLEMAVTRGANKVTVMALWDGATAGDGPGGTAHMIGLARQTLGVEILPLPVQALYDAAAI